MSDSEKKKFYQIAVPLTEKEIKALDAIKNERGVSKGFYVRAAINEKMERESLAEGLNK